MAGFSPRAGRGGGLSGAETGFQMGEGFVCDSARMRCVGLLFCVAAVEATGIVVVREHLQAACADFVNLLYTFFPAFTGYFPRFWKDG